MKKPHSKNQRSSSRFPINCKVKLFHPTIGEVVVDAQNMSNTGLFVATQEIDMPAIGEVVIGQVIGMAEDAPIVKMQIVRSEGAGVGLHFLE